MTLARGILSSRAQRSWALALASLPPHAGARDSPRAANERACPRTSLTQAEACPRLEEIAASVRGEHPEAEVSVHASLALDCSGRRTGGGGVTVGYSVASVRAADRAALSAAVRGLLGKLPAGVEGVVQGGWVD